MKKQYIAPEAEIVTFAKEDVITSSGFIFDWNTPSIDLGNNNGGFDWDTSKSPWKIEL